MNILLRLCGSRGRICNPGILILLLLCLVFFEIMVIITGIMTPGMKLDIGQAPLTHLAGGGSQGKAGHRPFALPGATLPGRLGYEDYEAWINTDRGHLKEIASLAWENQGQAVALLQQEIRAIRDNIIKIEQTGAAYVDPRRQYRIYDPSTTGRLYALHAGLKAREWLIASGFSLSPGAIWNSERVWDEGHKLQPTPPQKYAQVSEVARALNEIDLPDEAFIGYRVYLLPYSMGNTSGEGGPGYSIIASEPAGVDLIPNQVYLTVTHEFGHHLHLTYIGEDYASNPMLWRKYMDIRGIPRWSSDGEVKTAAWKNSPEEAFAEDVKVLLGGREAREDAYLAGYGDPRTDPAKAKRLAAFFRQLVSTGTGRESYALARGAHRSPWLD
ncbi:MAG: hypothetical protein HPY71_09800 [Firmicutes bacterium]|nr:hypothetical protein [Bacillota bacterium]